jgi:hypothetical protein
MNCSLAAESPRLQFQAAYITTIDSRKRWRNPELFRITTPSTSLNVTDWSPRHEIVYLTFIFLCIAR